MPRVVRTVLGFEQMQIRLAAYLRERVRRGELTERGLGRMTGISQPHVHNVLKGKRYFSGETADLVLNELGMDMLDLLEPEELREWHRRQ